LQFLYIRWRLALDKVLILTASLQKSRMIADINNAMTVQNDNLTRPSNGGQAMRDHEHGSPHNSLLDCFLDQVLTFSIQCTEDEIKNKSMRFCHYRVQNALYRQLEHTTITYLVASSKHKMRGFTSNARAIASLCFCPPLN
jgi:hypothetical protein